MKRLFFILAACFSVWVCAEEIELECDEDTQYSPYTGEECENDAIGCLTTFVCYLAQEDVMQDDDMVPLYMVNSTLIICFIMTDM
ncbi:hypothetical protein [uncultured Shewanella sp.]|uniref:hypothetical protein n=1 Tax=uncultured Shewanella sp. TaxID=173975 RepID=UPI002621CAC3|nr:hypothetical protein [uncultured Shewanella sp.]